MRFHGNQEVVLEEAALFIVASYDKAILRTSARRVNIPAKSIAYAYKVRSCKAGPTYAAV